MVVPTLNEASNIASLLARLHSSLSELNSGFEIIIVDDDSPDQTWRIAEQLRAIYPSVWVIRRLKERGLAKAVLAGWGTARGELLAVMDGDLQHPPEQLPLLVATLANSDAELVIGTRLAHPDGCKTVKSRLIISKMAGWWARVWLPEAVGQVRDPMSGFFVFKRELLTGIQLKPTGYKLLLEILARTNCKNLIEVRYAFDRRGEGGSKLGLRQALEFLIQVVRLAWGTRSIQRPFRRSAAHS